jgi:hypothetical protein
MPRSLKPTYKETRFLPVARLTIAYRKLAHPLRSSPITEPLTLIRDDPPLCFASVLSFSWGLHLGFSLNIETTGSHVPHKSLTQIHATFTPEAAQAVSRLPLNLSWTQYRSPVYTSSLLFRRLIEWFACARLSESYLPRSYAVTFPKRSLPWLFIYAVYKFRIWYI